MNKPYRYVARFVVEAKTPIHIGTHQTDFGKTILIARDFNNLPYLPGTTLAGWLSSQFKENERKELFGEIKDNTAYGSSVIISDGYLLNEKSIAHQALVTEKSHFLNRFNRLPIRDHVRIGHNGAGQDGGKFEEEVVFKGARFKFELKWGANEENDDTWKKLLDCFCAKEIRIGGGESKGYGRIKVIECKTQKFNLTESEGHTSYGDLTVDLNSDAGLKSYDLPNERISDYEIDYKLKLNGEDTFFIFSSGIPHAEYENMAQHYSEHVIEWNGTGAFSPEPKMVIPGTSIKGILAHRVAYHFNKENGQTVESIVEKDNLPNEPMDLPENIERLSEEELTDWKVKLQDQLRELESSSEVLFSKYSGKNNQAVKAIFGSETDDSNEDGTGQMGALIIEDIWLDAPEKEIFTHNKIDRFTHGTVQGALYSEETMNVNELQLNIRIRNSKVEQLTDKNGKSYLLYLKCALKDIKTGQLALSGRSAKGHGRFKLEENGK